MIITLRPSEPADVETFFAQQAEPEAVRRANVPSREREAFFAHWDAKIFAVAENRVIPENRAWTVLVDGAVAGNIVSWPQNGNRQIGYWLGQEFWGRGIGTAALKLFLGEETVRPLHADADQGNEASIRLLERCGFRRTGTDPDGFVLLVLD